MTDTAAIPELPRASEAAARLEGRSPDDPVAPDENPKSRREYTFRINYKDPRGHMWIGEFTNRVLNVGKKIRKDVLRAQLTGNTPVLAMGTDGWWLADQISHLQLSLLKRPDWADELEELEDPILLGEIHKEVMSHEAIFHRRGEDSGESKETTEDSAGAA